MCRVMLCLLCGRWCTCWWGRKILLSCVRCVCSISSVVSKHRMARGRMRVAHLWRRAVENVALWVIRWLCVDDAAVEVRVVRIVCMKRRRAIWRRRRVHGDSVHWCDWPRACVW